MAHAVDPGRPVHNPDIVGFTDAELNETPIRPRWNSLGPGIVAAATGVGAADLVATLTAGSRYGYMLLWAVVLGVIFKIVLVEGVDDQLVADEAQDDRQAPGEVDEAIEHAVDQEVELAQAHQRERDGGEDQVGLLGEAEDGRDRVEGEQDVRAADADHHEQHGGHGPLAVLVGEQLVAVVLVRGADGRVLDPLRQATRAGDGGGHRGGPGRPPRPRHALRLQSQGSQDPR